MSETWNNKLFFGDNLKVLREHVASESVDLIYLDPPFNSNASYNVLFAEKSGEKSSAQIMAFEDTWHWGQESEVTFQEIVTGPHAKLTALIEALRGFLGTNDMMAYLTMMAIRLVQLHRVLKPTGSIYLHCDPTASHYLKLVMDAVFGPQHFRNEIIWRRADPKGHAFTRFPSTHDVILCFAKENAPTWNPQHRGYNEDYLESHYGNVEEGTGRRYTLSDCTNPNRNRPNLTYEWKGITKVWRWTRERMERLDAEGRLAYTKSGAPRYRRYLDEMQGRIVTSIWDDIPFVNSQAQERLGYPTQKPEALLERIILASSNEGDLVLDPFCGCGTAVAVAEKLGRRWIGIDITHLAIALMRNRLQTAFKAGLSPYEIIGDPKDVESAVALAAEDRYQFEWWALGLVDAWPAQDKKKGADTGIDGHISFFDDNSGKAKRIIVQVKSGHVNASHVRDLKGTLEREKAAIAVLVTLQEPTKPMKTEAIAAGFYDSDHFKGEYPRVQILTIRQLLDGAKVRFPQAGVGATFKPAPRKERGEQQKLF